MSKTQWRILNYLRNHHTKHGFMPTYREIGDACGLSSPASVSYQLQQLAALGMIRIYQGRQRAITLLGDNA